MQKSKLLVAVLGALIAMPALAEEESGSGSGFSGEIGVVSNYLYRGISQTGARPALQGSVAYEHSSGFYAELEASTSSFFKDIYKDTAGADGSSNQNYEIDLSLGLKNEFAGDFHYDVGFINYSFPGTYVATKADTQEVYGALGYKWVTAKYSYSLGKTFGVPGAAGTNYFEINADFPVAEGWSIGAHVGKQKYKGTATDALVAAGRTPSYTDYKVGVTKELKGFELGLAYSKTNAPTGVGTFYNVLGKDLGKGAFVASVSYAFK